MSRNKISKIYTHQLKGKNLGDRGCLGETTPEAENASGRPPRSPRVSRGVSPRVGECLGGSPRVQMRFSGATPTTEREERGDCQMGCGVE